MVGGCAVNDFFSSRGWVSPYSGVKILSVISFLSHRMGMGVDFLLLKKKICDFFLPGIGGGGGGLIIFY